MQADLSPRCIYIHVRYGIYSCEANKLNNRQCLFIALFGYDIGSRHFTMSIFFYISLDITFSYLNSE